MPSIVGEEEQAVEGWEVLWVTAAEGGLQASIERFKPRDEVGYWG